MSARAVNELQAGGLLDRTKKHLVEEILPQVKKQLDVQPDLGKRFAVLHARNIAVLAEDAQSLVLANRFVAAAVVARVMLESLFNLSAAARDREFAARKILYEIEQVIRRARLLRESDPGVDEHVKTIENEMRQLSDDISRTQRVRLDGQKWRVFDCAKTAGQTDIYRELYFVLSLQTHAEGYGMAVRKTGADEAIIVKVILYCVVAGSARLIALFAPAGAEERVNEIMSLEKELQDWVRSKRRSRDTN